MAQEIANLASFNRLIENGNNLDFFDMGSSGQGQKCQAHSTYESRTTNRVLNDYSETISSDNRKPNEQRDEMFWS